MSTTDDRTLDPSKSHTSPHVEHELSDFSWTRILWFLPISVLILVGFTLVCLYSFRGYKDETIVASSDFQTTELNVLHAKENEVLSQYKFLDKDKGRIRIPIARAMALAVEEHQNLSGKEWKPITDVYLEGAPFAGMPVVAPAAVQTTPSKPAASAIPAGKSGADGISIEEASPAIGAAPAVATPAANANAKPSH